MREESSRAPRAWWAVVVWTVLSAAGVTAEIPFERVEIDSDNPSDPHCKTLGDIDGDGLLDAIVASSSGDGMFWYEYPSWTKHTVRASGSWTTDMQAADIDADGDLDLVIPDSTAIKWYENPRPGGDPATDTWVEHTIGTAGANNHDVEVADIEPDGDLDVVSRRKGGGGTYFWRQGASPTTWTQVTVSTEGGEGIGLGDIDGDGDLDIAQNGHWVEQLSPTSWTEHTIIASWPDDVGAFVADVDGNGSQDVILAPSESSGRFSWFEANDPVAGPWIEHSIDLSVSFLHTFDAADVDHDGDVDFVTAEMHQSGDPDEVSVYFNDNRGTSWSQQVLSETGSHNVRVGDIGGDGDWDVFGANWNDSASNSAVVEMWENLSSPLALDGWVRHIVETSLSWNAVFVEGRDLNGDGLPDLVVGGWWYPNPGLLGGVWNQQTFGGSLHNMAVVDDFDRDGDLDVLGTDGQPGGENFSWAENEGSGGFTLRDIGTTAMGGDFLQGVSGFQVIGGGLEEIVLSWHNGGNGTALLTIPEDPTDLNWPVTVASATTNSEQVPVGDIDRDGDTDIHLGTSWLRQEANGTFSVQSGISLAGGEVPDRVVLADLDGDDDLDVVVGVEFGSSLLWGENNGVGGGWTEHSIASDFDYFSVDARDVDADGDVDVVGGAHQGSGEVSLYENDGTGLSWTTRVIDSGDSAAIDHHDGTRLVDMDLDGDLDIISVGWSKRSLVIYENRSIDSGGGGGGDMTPPEIVAARVIGAGTDLLVDFSEPLLAPTANNAANYSISPGVSVLSATLAANQQTVMLETSALTSGTEYELTVSNVADIAGNVIAAGSTATFELEAGDPTIGLVAYWPFDEGVGGAAHDISGNGHHGLLTNGAQWSAGTALDLDGGNDYVDAGTFDVSGSAVTFAAWIYAEDLTNCSSRDCRILSKATGTAEDDHTFMLSTISSGSATRLRFRLKTAGSTSTLIASSGDLVENRWTHVAAVYDGATMELFVDGVSVGSAGKTGSLTGDPSIAVWIGGNPPDPSGKPWDGMLDEVRIYDRALSAGELQGLPPASVDWIFASGFESGLFRPPWDRAIGIAQIVASATRIGARGARLSVGSTCALSETLIVEPPPTDVDGAFEACRDVFAEAVTAVTPGVDFLAGESIELREGFSVASTMTAEIDPNLTPFSRLREGSPSSESAIAFDFHLDASALALDPGEHLEFLVARDSVRREVLRLVLQDDGAGGLEMLVEARQDDGSYVATAPGSEVPLAGAWHHLRLAWEALDGSGFLRLSVDGVSAEELSGLSNAAQRIDSFEVGTVGGALSGPSGSLNLDAVSVWK